MQLACSSVPNWGDDSALGGVRYVPARLCYIMHQPPFVCMFVRLSVCLSSVSGRRAGVQLTIGIEVASSQLHFHCERDHVVSGSDKWQSFSFATHNYGRCYTVDARGLVLCRTVLFLTWTWCCNFHFGCGATWYKTSCNIINSMLNESAWFTFH